MCIRKLLLFVSSFVFVYCNTYAQAEYDIQLNLGQVDCANNIVCYDVQLRSNDGNNWNLAGQNYRLYYDGALATYRSGVSQLDATNYSNFALVQNVQNQNATGVGTLSFEDNLNFLNYTIDLANTAGGGTSLPSDGSWLTTSQVCFDVQASLLNEPTTCFEAVWARNGQTEEYATSFVEVSEWVSSNNTQMATGTGYDDLSSADGEAACLASACSSAGQYDIRLNYVGLDCSTNTACYDVQLSSTSGNNWNLAGQNYRLYYDASLAAFTSGTAQLGSDYQNFTLIQDIQDNNATGTGNLTFESSLGFLNYSIDLLNPAMIGDSLLGNGTWKTTSQLCFQLEGDVLDNDASCLEFVWARADSTEDYATSFVEVSEWVGVNMTQMATGSNYTDLNSNDGIGACFTGITRPNIQGRDTSICMGQLVDLSSLVSGNIQGSLAFGLNTQYDSPTLVNPLTSTIYLVRDSNTTSNCVDTSLIRIHTDSCDWGDLPDLTVPTNLSDYQTLNANSGPVHKINPTIFLGSQVDGEFDGQPSIDALGDGADEDGLVVFASLSISPGGTFRLPLSYVNTSGSTAYIRAWIDWNADGTFDEAAELVCDKNDSLNTINNLIEITAPVTATTGTPLGLRIRISHQNNMLPYGLLNEGEVEDYLINVACKSKVCIPITVKR